jgi:fumarate hydratase class II
MPGKVNPVIPEAIRQVVAQVIGNDAAVAFAGSQGDFELNVMLPVIARNLLESIRLLANVARLFEQRCVADLKANPEVLEAYAAGSPSIVTPLNRYLGYEEAAAVAKQALASGRTIREVVLQRGHVERGTLTEQQLDEALDLLRMASPH